MMPLTRTSSRLAVALSGLALAASTLLLATSPARAQDQRTAYPNRPVKLIIPYTPGAHADLLARAVAQKLSEQWNQSVVVENRAGGGGSIGTLAGAKAPNDGYNLLMTSTGVLIVNPLLQSKPPYDPIKDLDAVAPLVETPWALYVHPSVPANNVRELVEVARRDPGKLNGATPGMGTTNHLAIELLGLSTDTRFNTVHYKGSAQAMIDLMSGLNQLMFDSLLQMQHVKTGKLKALAVTSSKRSEFAPDVPSVVEAGFPGLELSTWFGLFVPPGVPSEIINKINADVDRAMDSPEVKERLNLAGFARLKGSADAFRNIVRKDHETLKQVVGKANIPQQ
jgi:tripartite-type tricarboxylate transporter receptor subunit TctC